MTSRITSGRIAEALVVGAACFAVLLVIFIPVVAGYVPQGDEYALIVESTPYVQPVDWSRWFASGYSEYFRPMPEWTDPFSDFLRPFGNLAYFINYTLWHDRWSAYLYLNYAVLAMGATLAFWFSRRHLACPLPLAASAALWVAFNPAVCQVVLWPSFVLEPLAAALAFGAFLFVVRGRPWLAMVAVIMALFTKETTVFAPVAAAITLLMVRRGAHGGLRSTDWLAAGILGLAPLALWIGARYLAFDSMGGTYAGREVFTHGVALLRWPLGLEGPLDAELFAKPI